LSLTDGYKTQRRRACFDLATVIPGSPILFVRKADGSQRLCINYRGLNEVTRKDAYPLPRVDDTLDERKDANFCAHHDLAFGFLQVRVRDKVIHKTAF
jgi:hypothetical protein